MFETYKSNSSVVAARQVEIPNHTVLSEITILGWEIQVAVSQNKPFILFRPEEWDDEQRPRFAVTARNPEYFKKVLKDLAKLPLEKCDQMQTLAYEEPIWIAGGVVGISKLDPEILKLWTAIAGSDSGVS